MSKKNKLKTRQAAHENDIAREKAHQAKREQKAAKASAANTVQGVQKQQKAKVKRKRRGIRLKKGAVVKGIKIKDAESRKRAMELLQEALESKMEVSDGEWEEMTAEQVAAESQAASMQQG